MSFTVSSASNSGTTATVTVTITVPAGNTVVVAVLDANHSTLGTLSDSAGNTYNVSPTATDGSRVIATYYSLAIPSGITSVSYNSTGTANTRFVMVWNVSATATISKADWKSVFFNFNAPNTTDGVTTGSLALTSTDGALFGYAASFFSTSLAAGTGFTSDGSFVANGSLYEHKSASASAAVTWTTTTSGDYILCTGIALQAATASAAPFIPIDTDERITLRSLASDFSPPNLLADQILKLPPFVQRELPGWMPKPAVVTDFHPPNLLADQILKPPPFTQEDLLYKVQWKGVYTDFAPPNLLADQALKLPPFVQSELPGWTLRARGVYTDFAAPNLSPTLPVVTTPLTPVDLSQQVRYRWVGSDFAPANLLTGLLPLPPTVPVDATISIRAKGVFTDFSPPNLSLSVLAVAPAPLQPQDSFLRLEYRWIRSDTLPPNLPLSELATAAVAPIAPQDLSGIRLEARTLRSDFIPPNLTLYLPVPPPAPLSVPAGRHGTRQQARKRRQVDVLRAKVQAFKDQRAEADRALMATEEAELTARAKLLKRVRVKPLVKPIEDYAPVRKAIEKRAVVMEQRRSILEQIRAHQLEAERIEREIRDAEDEEAALHLMHYLMMESWYE